MTAPPAQLSEAVADAGFGAGTWLAQVTVILAGQVMVGGVSSNTTMTWAHVAVLPHSSVAK
jgi:hypothetical protein